MARMATNNDLFALLPPEVWLTILSHLTPEAHYTLKLTSSHMRELIETNAARIANDQILLLYPREAAMLQSTFIDGWLVPTHKCVLSEEERIKFRKPSIPSDSVVITKLSQPGPQYLRFLTEYSFDIRVYHEQYMAQGSVAAVRARRAAPVMTEFDTPALNVLGLSNQPEKFTESVGLFCVRRFLNRLDRIAGGRGNGLEMSVNEMATMKCTESAMAWFYK